MTGQVIKRGDQRYLVRIFLGRDPITGKRSYHTETFHGSKRGAEGKLRDLLTSYEKGTLVARSTKTLNEHMEKWLATVRLKVKNRTYEDYAGIWERYLKDGLGHLQLARINVLAIQKLYNDLVGRGLSPATVRRLHSVLNPALRQAVRWRLLATNPATDVELPTRRRKEVIRAMTLEQALAFLGATLGHRWGSVLSFALQTGMRPEEYLALQWSDIDWERAQARIDKVLVRPKGGGWKFETPKTKSSRRMIDLDPRLLEELKTHRAAQLERRLFAGEKWQAGGHDFVFTNDYGGPISGTNLLLRGFKPVLKAAGLPATFRLYDLRHTQATLLLLAGEHAKVVSERLGHASIQLTLDTYSFALPSMQVAAAKKIGDLLSRDTWTESPPAAPKVVSLGSRRRS